MLDENRLGVNKLPQLLETRMAKLGLSVDMLVRLMRSEGYRITRTTIYYWLKDKRRPTADMAKAVAKVLDIDEDKFLDSYESLPHTNSERLRIVQESS